jgi:hypothetical protein
LGAALAAEDAAAGAEAAGDEDDGGCAGVAAVGVKDGLRGPAVSAGSGMVLPSALSSRLSADSPAAESSVELELPLAPFAPERELPDLARDDM